MIYTNDEIDKKERQKNFLISVFILPLIIGLLSFGFFYLVCNYLNLNSIDKRYSYGLAFSIAFFIGLKNKTKWFKLTDNSYGKKSYAPISEKITFAEPIEYEEEFYYSKGKKVISIILGVMGIGIGIFILTFGKSVMISLVTIGIGLFLAIKSIVEILDKTPKLKLGKKGLWTTKLGFVDWNDIAKAQVIENNGGRSPQLIFQVYLKDSVFAGSNEPDETLNVTEFEDGGLVAIAADNLMSKRDELTT